MRMKYEYVNTIFGKQFCENNFVDDLNVCNCIKFFVCNGARNMNVTVLAERC
jgi:hypothetical protein